MGVVLATPCQQVSHSLLLTGSVHRYSVRVLQLRQVLGSRWHRCSA
jgi:hypothetical protein